MKITAYLKPVCGWSGGVRDVFEHYGLEYEEKLISEPENYAEMITRSGQPLSPCVEIDGKMLASSFDIYHPGYTLMLKEARDHCDYLIAALHDDPKWERQDKNSPIMSLHERFLVLKSIRYIDEIAVYEKESELKNLLKFYR